MQEPRPTGRAIHRVAAATILAGVVAATAIGAAGVPAPDPSGVSCRVEWAPMRDGVKLATEVYLPASPGKYPVVLTRSPYNRGMLATGRQCDKDAKNGG